jgi:uncharacterized protein
MKIVKLCFLLLICLLQVASGQPGAKQGKKSKRSATAPSAMYLEARSGSDEVLLRWLPPGITEFQHGARVGYFIERAEIVRGKQGALKKLNSSPVLPWREEEWKHALEQGRKDTLHLTYAELAYDLLDAEREGKVPSIPSTVLARNIKKVMKIRQQLENRLSMLLLATDLRKEAAYGAGLAFTDKTALPGVEYLYMVSPAVPHKEMIIAPGRARVGVKQFDKGMYRHPITADGQDGRIFIKWPKDSVTSCYYIERARDGSDAFVPLNQIPYLVLSRGNGMRSGNGYQDTAIANYIPYRYRVYGMTHFADRVLIGEVVAMGRDRTPPPPPRVLKPKHLPPHSIVVTWESRADSGRDLKGFIVGRDTSIKGTFPAIHAGVLATTQRMYIDTTAYFPEKLNYTVRAVDTAGNASSSLPESALILDSIPPAPPVWIGGVMDTNGVVTLKLRRNKESDLMGYRIFRANNKRHEFSPFFNSFHDSTGKARKDTVFTDTVSLKTSTPYVYYRATALDGHFNQSVMSEILTVRRHDIVAPAMPVIKSVKPTDSSVTIVYSPSISSDARQHFVFRKEGSDTTWQRVAVHKRKDSVFVDRNVRKHVLYRYAVQAVDSAGNASPLSPTVTARPYDTGIRPGVTNVTARYDSTAKKVTVSWSRPKDVGPCALLVYRSINGSAPNMQILIKDEKQNSWTDERIRTKGRVSYRMMLRTRDGGESALSDSAFVVIP